MLSDGEAESRNKALAQLQIEEHPNDVHKADILFLPHDRVGRKIYRYCLCIVDVASRFKAAEPLTDKTAASVAEA